MLIRKILSVIIIIAFTATNITYAGPLDHKDTLRPPATVVAAGTGSQLAGALQQPYLPGLEGKGVSPAKTSSAGAVAKEIAIKPGSVYFAKGAKQPIPGLLDEIKLTFRDVTYCISNIGTVIPQLPTKPKHPILRSHWFLYRGERTIARFMITLTETRCVPSRFGWLNQT